MTRLFLVEAFLLLLTICYANCAVTKDELGSYNVLAEDDGKEEPVNSYTLDNGVMSVQIMEYGATIMSIKVPDKKGNLDDIVLGYNNLEGYFNTDNPYFGATLGRVANRIGGGQFKIDDVPYKVTQNEGSNTLNGGKSGFDKKLWTGKVDGEKVVMEYTSPDGEEGFPGAVTATVTYELTSDNILVIEYSATATKRTPINLSNMVYFNLAGQGAGSDQLYTHDINIKADQYLETDSSNIPTGNPLNVKDSKFDLSETKNLGLAITNTPGNGFDTNYVLLKVDPVATAQHTLSGRTMEVYTTQPSLQFYTFNIINSISGKSTYTKHAAFCMDAQNYPDAVNHETFPASVYGPGDTYYHKTQYKFGVTNTID